MRTPMRVLVSFLAVSLLGGCASGFKATHDHDASHDFSGYKTFAWISDKPMKLGPNVQVSNPLLEPRIMRAIAAGLTAKGYTPQENTAVDDEDLDAIQGTDPYSFGLQLQVGILYYILK